MKVMWRPSSAACGWFGTPLRSSGGEYEAPTGGHRVGLSFLCDSPGEVDMTHTDLVNSGYRSYVEPFDAFWGQRYATVFDPEGNPVDLFAPLS